MELTSVRWEDQIVNVDYAKKCALEIGVADQWPGFESSIFWWQFLVQTINNFKWSVNV